VSKSDLQTARKNWINRINAARSAGLPDSSWQDLMTKDIQSINAGHSPMEDAVVYDAIRASSQRSPIKDPQPQTSGPLDVLGNIAGDIRNVVTGFPSGIANYVSTLPEQMGDFIDLTGAMGQQAKLNAQKKYGMETDFSGPGDFAAMFVRDMSRTPVFGTLVPGLHTAAALTTDTGRKELEQHPVSTALDVGAAVAAGGNAGLFGTPAEAADAAEATKPTALEALQEGHPYKAVGRAALTGIENIPRVGERINRTTIRQVAMDLAIHPELTDALARSRGNIQNEAGLNMQDWMKENIIKPYKGLPQVQRELLARVAQGVGTPDDIAAVAANPRLTELLQNAKRLQEEAIRANPNMQLVKTTWDRAYGYAKKSPVARAYRKHTMLNKIAKDRQKLVQEALQEVKDREAKFGANDKLTQTAVNRLNEAQAKFEKADKAAGAALKDFNGKLRENAPPSFWAKLSQDVKAGIANAAQVKFAHNQVQLDEALSRIEASVDFQDLRNALGDPEEADRIIKEVQMTWTALAKDGADPVWLPNAAGSKLSRVRMPSVIPDARYAKASMSKQVAFNLSRSVQDIAVGLSETKRQALTEAGTNLWVNNYVKPFAKSITQVHDDIRKAIINGELGGMTSVNIAEQIAEETKNHFVEFDPTRYGLQRHFGVSTGEEIMIPKGVDKSLKYLGFTDKENPLFAAYDRGMNVWRFAVLTTPRHISHVLLGGLVMGLGQDPLFLSQARDALSVIKNGDNHLLAKFGTNTNDFNPDQMVAYSGAKSWGRIMTAVTGSVDWVKRLEEQATLMYKISYALKKGGGKLTDDSIAQANKVFVDQNAMSPFERATIRKVLPFWGFTRHIFRYLMTYPVDHPYRAAILANLANTHQADWASGLPQQMQFMFYLGAPDSNGNVTAVDYRSIDPFRSFYNDFTLGGLLSQTNPGIQFIAQQSGVNVLSATPELYPTTHYDAYTGTMVADRPKGVALSALESMIPEVQGADALFQLSDQYRNLKVSDPEAFQHRVYTTLGIPFGPEQINIPLKVETAQMKRYRDADTAINQAVQTGDFSSAKRYAATPIPSLLRRYFPGMTYATPQQIEAVYQALVARYAPQNPTGASLHALLPKPSSRRR